VVAMQSIVLSHSSSSLTHRSRSALRVSQWLKSVDILELEARPVSQTQRTYAVPACIARQCRKWKMVCRREDVQFAMINLDSQAPGHKCTKMALESTASIESRGVRH
jgi:hypothetical protein